MEFSTISSMFLINCLKLVFTVCLVFGERINVNEILNDDLIVNH